MTVPSLEPGEVHVWRLETGGDGGGRAVRAILGAYVGSDPARIRLAAGPGGKPRLEPGSEAGWLRFNLSHTRGRALLGLARDREVGVDVERIASDRAISTIADELFSPREAAVLRSFPPSARIPAFFRLWTRKEAVLKAIGTGLGLGPALDEIEVLSRTVAARGVSWALRDVNVGPGYAAALAVEGTAAHVRVLGTWRLPEHAAAPAPVRSPWARGRRTVATKATEPGAVPDAYPRGEPAPGCAQPEGSRATSGAKRS
jgi:4'-phosphopantetheinyl transferase